MKKTLLLLSVFVFNLSVFGQVAIIDLNDSISFLGKEKTILQTNTNVVLTGEYLFYKLFTIENNSLSTISKIGYVELINANKEIVLNHKIKLKNGVGYSEFFIPSKILSGTYKLVGYTNFSKNNKVESFFIKDVFIINPYTANTQKVNNEVTSITKINKKEELTTKNTDSPLLYIGTQKREYTPREAINININIDERIKNGNYSLSIRKLDSIETIDPKNNSYSFENKTDTFYIPEMRGELISGKITNSTNELDIKDKHIAISLPGTSYTFKVAKTNSKGQFFFNLNEYYDNSNALFQVIESNNEDFKMKLDSIGSINYDSLHFSDLQIDSKLKKTIEDRNIQNQIENAYYEKKRDSIIPPSDKELFYGNLSIKYELDDYTRFKTVRETFIEVIQQAGLRSDKDNYRLVVYDDVSNNDLISSDLQPLVLVDGVIVQNNNDVVFYNPKKIKSISILQGQYIYGSKNFQGIIDIKTFLEDFKTTVKGAFFIEKQLKKPQSEKVYFQPNYSNAQQLNNRIPDYRRQLLWVPEVNPTEKKYTTYTSDIKGVFEIKLEGINSLGAFISTSTFIEVK